jgi:hypothetical protein
MTIFTMEKMSTITLGYEKVKRLGGQVYVDGLSHHKIRGIPVVFVNSVKFCFSTMRERFFIWKNANSRILQF